MFCIKCGKPNDDDAAFCEFCGAAFDEPVPAPAAAPAAVPTPKKRGKAGVIAAIVSSAAIVIAAAVVLLILKPWSSPDNSAILKGAPVMTVNGKDIPVSFAMMGTVTGDECVFMLGKADGEAFEVLAVFNGSPKSNTKMNAYRSNECYGGLHYSGNGARVDEDGYYKFDMCTDKKLYIEVGEYVPGEYIELAVSGTAESGDRTFEYTAGGRVDFNAGLDGAYSDWMDQNRIPANS